MPTPYTPKTLVLIDAYAMIYRAHFAFIRNPLTNSKGLNVSALTGFSNLIYELLNKFDPTHFAIAFDPSSDTKTFRANEYDFYKANREAMPEDIQKSLPYIRRLAAGLRIPIVEVEGYEADDVVGTLAKLAEKDGFEVFMVTTDKDYEQLVSDKIWMYKPSRSGKPSELITPQKVLDKWGIEEVKQVIDILGLMGDSVDNIPGIKGVGPKTAAKLIQQFGSVENMLENTDKLKGKLKEKVENDRANALISKYLATIICNVPLDYQIEAYKMEKPDAVLLTELFQELEFRSIGKRFLGESYELNSQAPTKNKASNDLFSTPKTRTQKTTNDLFSSLKETSKVATPLQTNSLFSQQESEEGTAPIMGKKLENVTHDYQIAQNEAQRKALIEQLLAQKIVSFDTETTSVNANNAELVGLSFSFKKQTGWYVPLPADQAATKAILAAFKPFFEAEKIAKIAQNIKYDLLVLKWYDIVVKGVLHDTMLAHYLLEPEMRHNLNLLSETYLQYTPISIETLIGKGKKQRSMRQVPLEQVAPYATEDADLALQLHDYFKPLVDDTSHHVEKLYREVELPLVPVLAEMEFNGIALDGDFLNDFSKELTSEILGIQSKVVELAGVEFNLDSPKQLGDILFNKLKIPYKGKKTKTGQYSTNEATLSRLAEKGDYEIINKMLTYRELNKLNNTYVSALPALLNPKTGRIHSSFNQAVTSTGRLSSTNPNLQNIPIRTELGRKVRKAFIPRSKDFVLLAADYSQIELRLMAELSRDEIMIEAFKNGLDIHTATAARVYKVADLEAVTSEQRRNAKMVNFGLIYGISAHGLAQRLGISRTEAKEIIEEYFNQYKGIKTYMKETVELAREKGYAETILGRRRYLKDINSRNHTTRQFAERNAINTPIQGSSADMIKVAMINIHHEMKTNNMQSKMILQVHDELVFDAHRSELETLQTLVVEKMKSAIPLSVPLEVGLGIGDNWLEAH